MIDPVGDTPFITPELLDKEKTRIRRIAQGSGTNTSDVRALLKQYKMMKQFVKKGPSDMKNMDEKQMKKMAKKFGGKMGL